MVLWRRRAAANLRQHRSKIEDRLAYAVPSEPTEGRRLGELANPDISGLECTHKGHMDSTEKLPYVVPIGNSGRHARARPAKTLQEY